MKSISIKGMMVLAAVILLASFTPPAGITIGDNAPDFQLKNTDGKMVSLANDKKAKGFIVVFTCNHCPFAKKYEDRIIALDKKYRPKGYPVIAINPTDPAQDPEDGYENMQKRAKEKGYPFPYLYDETQQTTLAYGAAKTPTVFVLKKENGRLVVKYLGAIDDNTEDASAAKTKYVEDAVNELLNGKEVTTTITKAIGCGIKPRKA